MALWNRIPRFWRNFITGVLVAIVLLGLGESRLTDGVSARISAFMMESLARLDALSARATGHPEVAFALVVVDDVPGDAGSGSASLTRLPQLIGRAVEAGVSQIVVDLASLPPAETAAADALNSYLQSYSDNAPPLVLLRPDRADTGSAEFAEAPFGEPVAANVFSALRLPRAGASGVAKHNWWLLQQGCLKGRGGALPSLPLLSVALLRDHEIGATGNRDDLRASLKANAPAGCDKGAPQLAVKRPVIMQGDVFEHQPNGEPLVFTLPWRGESRNGELLLLGTADLQRLDDRVRQHLAGRILAIASGGGTRLETTPVGAMPEMLLELNAVKSLAVFGQITPTPLYVRVLLLLGLIVVFSLLFAGFASLMPAVVAVAVALVFLTPLSYWALKLNLWFDALVLLAAIKIQHLLSQYAELRALRPHATASDAEVLIPMQNGRELAEEPGERRLDVRLRPAADGSYDIVVAGNAGLPVKFSLAPDSVKERAEGFDVALKVHSNSRG